VVFGMVLILIFMIAPYVMSEMLKAQKGVWSSWLNLLAECRKWWSANTNYFNG
jgi:hypothetical protein